MSSLSRIPARLPHSLAVFFLTALLSVSAAAQGQLPTPAQKPVESSIGSPAMNWGTMELPV